MKSKRIIAMLLALACIACSSGCGTTGDKTAESEQTTVATEATTKATTKETTKATTKATTETTKVKANSHKKDFEILQQVFNVEKMSINIPFEMTMEYDDEISGYSATLGPWALSLMTSEPDVTYTTDSEYIDRLKSDFEKNSYVATKIKIDGSEALELEPLGKKAGIAYIAMFDGKVYYIIAGYIGDDNAVYDFEEVKSVFAKMIDSIKFDRNIETEPQTEATTENSGATLGELNALKSAKSYLEYSSFSYTGLIDQLEYEGYSTAESTYAVDNCGADWFEQAAQTAADYLEYSSFSRQGLIDQLIYEGFTAEQAEYGVKSVGY